MSRILPKKKGKSQKLSPFPRAGWNRTTHLRITNSAFSPLKLSLRLGRLPRSQTSPSVEPDASTPSDGGVPTTSDRDVELSTIRFFRNPKVQSLSYLVLYTLQNRLSSLTSNNLSSLDLPFLIWYTDIIKGQVEMHGGVESFDGGRSHVRIARNVPRRSRRWKVLVRGKQKGGNECLWIVIPNIWTN